MKSFYNGSKPIKKTLSNGQPNLSGTYYIVLKKSY